jgi:hypothetical protein
VLTLILTKNLKNTQTMSISQDPRRYMACALRLRLHATPFSHQEFLEYQEQVRLVTLAREKLQREATQFQKNKNTDSAPNQKVASKKKTLKKVKKMISFQNSHKDSTQKNPEKVSQSSGANLSNYTFGKSLPPPKNPSAPNSSPPPKKGAPKTFNPKKKKLTIPHNDNVSETSVITMDSTNITNVDDTSTIIEAADQPLLLPQKIPPKNGPKNGPKRKKIQESPKNDQNSVLIDDDQEPDQGIIDFTVKPRDFGFLGQMTDSEKRLNEFLVSCGLVFEVGMGEVVNG